MRKKKALITGISGQDGSFLSELLLEKDYDVMGIIRRNSVLQNQTYRINHIFDEIKLEYGDLNDLSSLTRILNIFKPDEIYHLGAQSHVRISFDQPIYTTKTIVLGTLNLLEAVRSTYDDLSKIKIYNAASCLPAGTKILIKKKIIRSRYGKNEKYFSLGTKKIEDVQVGDKVLSFNVNTSKKEYKTVEKIGNRISNNMYTILLNNGNTLRLSDNHPVFVHNKG